MGVNTQPDPRHWTRAVVQEARRIAAAARLNARIAERKQLAIADAVRAEGFWISEFATDPRNARQRAALRAKAIRAADEAAAVSR